MKDEGHIKKQNKSKQSSGAGLIKQLLTLALIPALMVGGFMTILLLRESDAKKRADQIKSIADYMVVANQVVHQLQRERGTSAGYLASSGSSMTDTMKKQRLLTDRYYNVMENYTKTLDMAKLGYRFARRANASSRKLWKLPSIREKITSLSIGNKESNMLYTEIVDDILGTFQEASVIIKDSELSFPFTACVNLIMAKEMAGMERTIITGFVARNKPATQSEMHEWMRVSKGQEALLAVFKYQITEKLRNEFLTKMSESNINAVIDLRKRIAKNLANGNFGLKPEFAFATTTGRINDLKKIEDAQLQEILKKATALSSEKTISVIIYSGLTGGCTIAMFILCFLVARSITKPITTLSRAARSVAGGELDHNIKIKSRGEIGELADSFNDMISNLRLTMEKNDAHDWLKTGQMELSVKMRGKQDIETLGNIIIGHLAEYLNAQVGILYMSDTDNRLKPIGSYAYVQRENTPNEFMPGEGPVGQAASEKKHILLTNYPDDSINIKINSGLVDATPKQILIFPLVLNDTVRGVVELGSFLEFQDIHLTFLGQVAESIAVALNTVISRNNTEILLEQTQQQAEELQAREEALRQNNEELEENAIALKESESRLQAQQEELRQTNEEIEEQKEYVEEKNKDLQAARKTIEERAQELEQSSKYKSEFLANMSHELRTPLNSILLLSRLLGDNKDGSLSEDQVESVNSISSSGNDLLALINDVLDLSKVESGKMDLQIEDMYLNDFCNNIKRNFKHIAKGNGISLNIEIAEGLPDHISTDEQRVEQIIKNFLSNAFKFTSEGSISLKISRPNRSTDSAIDFSMSKLDPAKTVLFSVVDTGIGIPDEKQRVIFEAFKQADGSTSRKYGGTGLGLSISKELSGLLNGRIHMTSTHGKGSTFTLYLPEAFESEIQTDEESPVLSVVKTESETDISKESEKHDNRKEIEENIKDDRKTISEEDKSILIIEDDPVFLKILRDLTREHGFKCLVAGDGETGLQFADYYKPSGIILDLNLPGINGWTVMSRLKDNPESRHIPVHFISASDHKFDALKMGAIDYVTKPVSPEAIEQVFAKFNKIISKPVKDLLVVEDNPEQAEVISSIIGSGDVNTTTVSTAMKGYDHILTGKFDCMVLDISLPDMSGIELLSKIRENEEIFQLPVIVYTGRDLTNEEKRIIDEYAATTIIKGEGSHRKLLDETTLFLHRVEAHLPETQRKLLRMIHDKEAVLTGKKILVVDDDMRNVFSIKKVLEDKGIEIVIGKNGKEGLTCLNDNPDVNLVLMDIMMPEMDGYTAIGELRKQDR
ncbi:MAG: response regulator [Candidatus Scalindua sp.]|jgi:tubulin-specific chaperone A|nr:response regulator [Candidatus Scalindua sp.]MDV5167103.1 response regulator [Candidatus Scalindua sp.]